MDNLLELDLNETTFDQATMSMIQNKYKEDGATVIDLLCFQYNFRTGQCELSTGCTTLKLLCWDDNFDYILAVNQL
jgi:hypothetical protein